MAVILVGNSYDIHRVIQIKKCSWTSQSSSNREQEWHHVFIYRVTKQLPKTALECGLKHIIGQIRVEKLWKSEPLKASLDFTDWTGGCVWAFGHAGAVRSLAGKPESAETKTNTDPTIQYILALARTHRSDPQLCVWAVHLQTRKRLFVFPGICKHPQQKQVPLEWEENLTPSGQLHSHSAAPLMSLGRHW